MDNILIIYQISLIFLLIDLAFYIYKKENTLTPGNLLIILALLIFWPFTLLLIFLIFIFVLIEEKRRKQNVR